MTNNIHIQLADWHQGKEALMAVRTQVFVEEQQVPMELEMDDQDATCIHIKATTLQGQVVGTARLLPNQYIGRMCVLKAYRHQGVGGKMLVFLIDIARKKGYKNVMLNAQISALPFYQKHGFVSDSEVFMEAGIPHKHMSLKL